jgi:F-type H+-transporting ATPase subunit b
MRRLAVLLFSAAVLSSSSFALAAEEPHGPDAEHATEGHGNADAHAEHGAGHSAEGHHVPTFHDINWFYGVLGEREGVEPSFVYRPKGMPAPFGAYLLNAAVLYFILFRFLKKPVSEGLKNRKASILKGMEEASRMRKDAEARLADYEDKLARIDQEIERVRREMREDLEADRARILAEARVRRERMERDARLLVEQELVAARETLTKELVASAFRSASSALSSRVTGDDQQRIAEEYLAGIPKAGASLRRGA